MTQKIIGGSFLSLFGLAIMVLGMMFIIASDKQKSRFAIGIILTMFGSSLLIMGVRLFRAGISLSPAKIKEKILQLAGKNHGELPEDIIIGEIGKSDTLNYQLLQMIKSGIAKKGFRNERAFYLFSQFNMKLVVKQCPYCGNDYPVRDDIETCSSCGGNLKISIQRIGEGDDSYTLD